MNILEDYQHACAQSRDMKWRLNFFIQKSYFNLFIPYWQRFFAAIPLKDGRQLLDETVLEYAEGGTRAYMPVASIEATAEWIKDIIITDPAWADQLHKETERITREYFAYAYQVAAMDVSQLSAAELVHVYETLHTWQGKSHTHGVATTWFVDSDGERFSNYLRTALTQHLQSQGVTDPAQIVDTFVLLTTPHRSTLLRQEQQAFLQLVQEIQTDPQAQGAISGYKTDSERFCHLPHLFQDKVRAHHKMWCWIPYGYVGPAYSLEHYINLIAQYISSGAEIGTLLEEENYRDVKVVKQQNDCINEFDIPPQLQHLFVVACDIIWLKDYRKACLYHGLFVMDIVTGEIAKRLHLSRQQASHFLDEEVGPALLHGYADEHVLNERNRYCVVHAKPGQIEYLVGQEARNFMKTIDVETTTIDVTRGLVGSCACPGEASGAVKIVNTVEDMAKMKEGDIMVAHTTFPALVPAMKKAAAIVTEDGGITCHAAIVARELHIPCVVGVRDILNVIHDGDQVQVQATQGIIRLISS